eukprot:scaffold108757_cov24-Tisochrysis_lutea.AAC.2
MKNQKCQRLLFTSSCREACIPDKPPTPACPHPTAPAEGQQGLRLTNQDPAGRHARRSLRKVCQQHVRLFGRGDKPGVDACDQEHAAVAAKLQDRGDWVRGVCCTPPVYLQKQYEINKENQTAFCGC